MQKNIIKKQKYKNAPFTTNIITTRINTIVTITTIATLCGRSVHAITPTSADNTN